MRKYIIVIILMLLGVNVMAQTIALCEDVEKISEICEKVKSGNE